LQLQQGKKYRRNVHALSRIQAKIINKGQTKLKRFKKINTNFDIHSMQEPYSDENRYHRD